jgi:hypothetical protein
MDTHELLRSLLPEAESAARHEPEKKASVFAWPLLKDLIALQDTVIEPLTPEDVARRAGQAHGAPNKSVTVASSTTATVSFPEVSIQLADGLKSIQAATSSTNSSMPIKLKSPRQSIEVEQEEQPVFLRNRSSKLFHVETEVQTNAHVSDLPSFLSSYQADTNHEASKAQGEETLNSVFARITRPKSVYQEQTSLPAFLHGRASANHERPSERPKSLGETLMRLASQEPSLPPKKLFGRNK